MTRSRQLLEILSTEAELNKVFSPTTRLEIKNVFQNWLDTVVEPEYRDQNKHTSDKINVRSLEMLGNALGKVKSLYYGGISFNLGSGSPSEFFTSAYTMRSNIVVTISLRITYGQAFNLENSRWDLPIRALQSILRHELAHTIQYDVPRRMGISPEPLNIGHSTRLAGRKVTVLPGTSGMDAAENEKAKYYDRRSEISGYANNLAHGLRHYRPSRFAKLNKGYITNPFEMYSKISKLMSSQARNQLLKEVYIILKKEGVPDHAIRTRLKELQAYGG